RHLLDVGCRTLLACIPPEAGKRAEGAAAALEESLISARLLFHDDSALENSAQSDLLRAHEIDGIFFASDDHALRELPLLQSYGYRIPEDLAVLGCFDTVTRGKPESTLSSLDIRPELIINKIWGMYQEKLPEAQITVPPVISARASTLRFHASKHRLQPEIIRLSSRGISLHQTLDFYLPKLLELAPDAAVVLLGISDMVHPAHLKEVSQYEKDLNTLLEKLSSIRCRPVICDLYLCDESKLFERHEKSAYYGLRNPNERIRAANKIIHETTRKYGAACYRLSAQVEKHGGLNPDGEHLEESAQKILAESLAKLLHPLAPRRIVCLGDSNTFGCYGNRSYVDFLKVNLLTRGEI
ncbi:MAG: substrate-binding domain-containing protein, partial [Victivallales bacterium]